jgi:ribosomal protein S27AE
MPTLDELEARWQPSRRAVIRAMKDWRRQHPQATFREIEAALDQQLAQLCAEMLRDLARTSPNADLTQTAAAERPTCPSCGAPLQAQGPQPRTLPTEPDQAIALTRSYATCPPCGAGLFPPR